MSRPSEKAQDIAEELLDYVHPGMTRAAAIQEIATLVDEMNSDLIEVVTALANEVSVGDTGRHAVLLHHLREVLANYQPLRFDAEGQHELFPTLTHTSTGTVAVAGQMP